MVANLRIPNEILFRQRKISHSSSRTFSSLHANTFAAETRYDTNMTEMQNEMVYGQNRVKLSFEMVMNGLRLPVVEVEKNGYGIYFLIDSGATQNHIRRDCIELVELQGTTEMLDDKESSYGFENIEKVSDLCMFDFNADGETYREKFLIMEDGSPFTFPIKGGYFHIAGLLGTPFLTKYRASMDFADMTISFDCAEPVQEELVAAA